MSTLGVAGPTSVEGLPREPRRNAGHSARRPHLRARGAAGQGGVERFAALALTGTAGDRAGASTARVAAQLAGDDADPNTGLYGPKARPDLRAAAESWERYLRTDPQPPDASLARVMLQVYGEFGLNQPPKAAQAADVVAQADESSSAFLTLARYASLAKQSRKADLAGRRAIALAPDSQRKVVKEQVKAIDAQAAAQAAGAGGAGAGGGAAGAGGGLPGAGGSTGGGGP